MLMSARELSDSLSWLVGGTSFLFRVVDRLDDDQLREPSALPGWTRAHVIGHVARNAEALGRLAAWARTGLETPMYTSPMQRDADIEASAALPADRLRAELTSTAGELTAALDELDEKTWQTTLLSAQGRLIPATEVPWLRVREVWLHAVDLAAGARLTDLPDGVLDALLGDVAATMSAREGCPSVVLEPTDREQTWRLGLPDATPVALRGTAAELTGWLVGREPGEDLTARGPRGQVQVPAAPRWL
jgi:maleylpyruvate isomerase